jgi:hypothetical protein
MARDRGFSVVIVGAGFGRPAYMTQYAERLRVLDPDEFEFSPPPAA